jgi:2-polyprenyl-3-methyl-5-hydroxy-6-metoxy-1,4-benzoquinol methylase
MKIKDSLNKIRNKLFPESVKRNSLAGLLNHIKNIGFVPKTIVDIGAAQGTFTMECLIFSLTPSTFS